MKKAVGAAGNRSNIAVAVEHEKAVVVLERVTRPPTQAVAGM